MNPIPIKVVAAEYPPSQWRSQFTAPPPLSLYIHFPWCIRKCPYCDFNSHQRAAGEIDSASYTDSLLADLQAALPVIWGRPIESIFIGGGTPSLYEPQELNRLLEQLRALLPLRPSLEITLEANPGTFDLARFKAFAAAGVNRLSLGVQSFSDERLQAIGRIHSAVDAKEAIAAAMDLFERVNIDLMYALPGQSMVTLTEDLQQGLAFNTGHVSYYHLTLEPNTPFYAAPPALPDDDSAAEMQDYIEQQMAAAGYEHYETSAYGRPGQRATHNLNYWTFGDYLGIGAGAHSKLTTAQGVFRQMRHKHPAAYLKAAAEGRFLQLDERVSEMQLPFEFMMNALRLTDGFNERLFTAHTGLPINVVERQLQQAIKQQLLVRGNGNIKPSKHGASFLNDLLQIFLD